MAIDSRYKVSGMGLKRDIRPWTVRFVDWLRKPSNFAMVMVLIAFHLLMPMPERGQAGALDLSPSWGLFDLAFVIGIFYFQWVRKQLVVLPLRLPTHAGMPDKGNPTPTGKPGKPEGILFLGNVRDGTDKGKEIWITNSDARTHILLLGTTGAGKSEALKSFVSNALIWGSGFVYVDGKAQNTLWGDVYSLARRFGRDDDVLVLNYMTGNSDNGSRSNSLNPFAIGSASYLVQMMSGLMDDAGDDNAMWKGRAIALMSALMPALTWKRDNQGLLLDVGVIRDHLTLEMIIKMSRDNQLPDKIIRGLESFLETLPGYVDSAFDNEGKEKPPSADQPMVDLSQTRQQHGYLTMQFTRALSSLADEYGYIFKQQMADIDMMDVVLNRRILVVLIPALEKSPDEAANLGKIVVAALKGMMGATLGAELEGEQSSFIDNNPTTGPSPFMTIFDEVGYYVSPGMGVMAAQARSLGFCLIFAGQDMPALQKRVKEEALSITGNCNLKVFGKLEDPTETKDFFEKTVSSALVSEVSGFASAQGVSGKTYTESDNITFQARKEASYDDLKRQGPGQFHFLWSDKVIAAKMFYAEPKRVEVVRVQRMIGVTGTNWAVEARDKAIGEVGAHLRDAEWYAANDQHPIQNVPELQWMIDGVAASRAKGLEGQKKGMAIAGALMRGYTQRATQAVSAPGLDAGGAGGAGYWPFGGATTPPVAGQPPMPPAGMPPVGQQAMGAAPVPPWMGGAPVQPAQAAGVPQQPAAAAVPPWMGGAPAAGAQPQGFVAPTQPPPPPWLQPAASAAPPMPPAGMPMAQPMQQAQPPVPPSAPLPPWMGGAPAQPAQAQAQPPVAAPPAAPLPPWMGGGVPAQQPQQQQPVPPVTQQPPFMPPVAPPVAAPVAPPMPPSAPLPPWMGGGAASAAAPTQPPVQPPIQAQAPTSPMPPPPPMAAPVPPWMAGAQGMAGAPAAQPVPPQAPPPVVQAPSVQGSDDDEIDAILRQAAEELSEDMQIPPDEADDEGDSTGKA